MKPGPGQAFEHELKFVVSQNQVSSVLHWLSFACHPDPEFPRNIVSSIYYDTWDWLFLQEKLNGDCSKTKVRIRWYEESDCRRPSEHAFIEVKSKIGARRTKFRMPAPYPSAWFSEVSLEDPRLLALPRLLQARGVFLEQPVFPVFVIRFQRCRFVEMASDTRVCADDHIGVSKVNRTMLPGASPLRLNTAVIEVKGKGDTLPAMLACLPKMGGQRSSFSKYLMCYQHLSRVYL